MNELRQFLQSLGPSKIFVILGTTLGALAFVAYLIVQSSKPPMALLFSQLEPADGARIIDKLESMGIEAEIRGDGSQIYAPQDRIARIRMELAQAGLPSTGSIGYEIFDKADVLGTSSAVMDINYARALEGEISKSIRSIQGVASARVHLVVPKKELFSRDRNDPSASIVLRMNRGRLSQGQVQGIQHLVAAAVPGLMAERITIVDDKGSLLARQNEPGSFDIGNNMDLQRAQEQKLSGIVEALLEKTLGAGKSRVEVNAAMDFDRVTLNSEEFNPEGQVARSISNSNEEASSTEQGASGAVTVQNNLPNQQAGAGGAANPQNSNKNNRTDENTTYEISKTVKTHVKETGTIKKLSVAVLVDGKVGEDGKYIERTKEELEQISKLVKTAVGFNEERGDVVEVVNMPFVQSADNGPAPSIFEAMLAEVSLPSVINVAIPGLIGLLIILLFVKPFATRVLERIQSLRAPAQEGEDATVTSMTPQLPNPEQEMVILENTEGAVKASSVKQIRDIIDQNPEETVNIIRNWMTAPGATGQ